MPFWTWILLAAVLVAGVAIAQWRGWIDLRGTNGGRGSGNGALGFADEVFHPTKHEAQQLAAVEAELPAPAPAPGDGPLDLDGGRTETPTRRAGAGTRGAARCRRR